MPSMTLRFVPLLGTSVLISCSLSLHAAAKAPAAAPAPPCIASTGVSRASLSGVVTDQSGAAIPGAEVTTRCGDSSREVVTDQTGHFTLQLPRGTYTLRVVATGFAPAEQPLEILSASNTADVTLSVASLNNTVTVTADDYVALASTAGTKTSTPLIDTPQSISVITSEQLRARDTQTVTDTLRYTAGIDAEPYGIDTRVDWFFIRGFFENFDGLFLDGLALPKVTGSDAAWTANPFSLEQVNVIKGPASVLYGQNEPGGLVDLVSKQPTRKPLHELRFEGGTFDRFQGSADFGGPLVGSKHLFYRVNGLARSSGTQTNFVQDNMDYIAPSLTWTPDDRTRLTLLSQYLDYRTGSAASGTPAQGMTLAGGKIAPNPNGPIPVSYFGSEPSLDGFHKLEYFAGYQAERRLSDRFTVRQNFRWLHLGLPQYTGFYGNGFTAPPGSEALCAADPGAAICTRFAALTAINANQNNSHFAVDNQLQANLRTRSLSQTLLAGYNYQHQGAGSRAGYGTNALYNPGDPANGPILDIFTPTYGGSFPLPPPNFVNTRGTLAQHGVYLQDQLSYRHISVILSGREDWALENVRDLNAATQPATCSAAVQTAACILQNASKFTGRAGILYHAPAGIAPYFSFATSFNPVLGVSTITDSSGAVLSTKPFLPDTGKQYEVGLKYQPRGINALFTASLFSLTQDNVQTSDPNNPQNTVQSAQQRSRGIEVEGQASLSHSLNLIASATHEQVLFTKPYYDVVNVRPITVPANLASVWLDYNPRTRFGAGAGVRFKGNTAGATDNSFFVGSHTLFDAEVHYLISPRVRFGFNAQNVLDKTYVAYCSSTANCIYGLRRTMNGNLTYRFASLLQPWRRD